MTQLDKTIGLYTHTTHQNFALIYMEMMPPISEGEPGVMRVANSGCITPIVRHGDGSITWVEVGGLPLGTGLGSQLGYDEIDHSLAAGDVVILVSDGVIEAVNDAEEMFGFERFEQAVATGPTDSAEAMLTHLRTEIAAFVQKAEPYDDLTIVVARL